jgi:hypothetical protein
MPPSGALLLHEIKHNGFRVVARKDGNRVRLYSRPGNDLTYRQSVKLAVRDGEIAKGMRASIICYLLLASAVTFLNGQASLAQELSVEDRACILRAATKLPQAAALKIEGSRAIEGRVLEQPQSEGLGKSSVYRVKVEIDVSVAGQRSTYVFNCIHSGEATVIQPLGMR